MFPKPVSALTPNTAAFEVTPLVKPTGFREYDARWWFGVPGSDKPPELNLMGATALGLGLGTLLGELGVERDIVVGHDYRAYSLSLKMALINGLVASGCRVKDVGLAVTPLAYYAQFALNAPAVRLFSRYSKPTGSAWRRIGRQRTDRGL